MKKINVSSNVKFIYSFKCLVIKKQNGCTSFIQTDKNK